MIIKIPNDVGSSLGCLLYVIKNKDIVNYLNGLIEQGFLNRKFELTDKGKTYYKKLEVKDTTYLNITDLAVKYRNCFKNEAGKALKPGVTGSMKLIAERLLQFKEDYPEYSDDQILKAIKNYVMSEANQGFQYLQKAHFTIWKKEGSHIESKLLTFCEELDDDVDDELTFDVDV